MNLCHHLSWHPSSKNCSWKLTFLDRMNWDTEIPEENLLGAMKDREYWKGVVNAISAEAVRWWWCCGALRDALKRSFGNSVAAYCAETSSRGDVLQMWSGYTVEARLHRNVCSRVATLLSVIWAYQVVWKDLLTYLSTGIHRNFDSCAMSLTLPGADFWVVAGTGHVRLTQFYYADVMNVFWVLK